MKKYQVDEKLVDEFEVEVKVQEGSNAWVQMRIAFGLLALLAVIAVGGIMLSWKTGDTSVFQGLLDTITPVITAVIGFYFGTKTHQDK